MDFFITRCPECQTAYKTTPSQLSAAKGKLRCGECGAVFTASENREPAEERLDPTDELAVDAPQRRRQSRRRQDPLQSLRKRLLQIWPRSTQPRQLRLVLQLSAVALLCLSLVLQYLWHNRLVLAQDPARRAWAAATCQILPCQLPPLQIVELLRGENLMIRSHPEQSGALQLTLGIHNMADFDQPLPVLSLTFRDRGSRAVAAAHFSPTQYLGLAPRELPLINAGDTLQIQLALADPGEQAINYEIDLLPSGTTDFP